MLYVIIVNDHDRPCSGCTTIGADLGLGLFFCVKYFIRRAENDKDKR